MLRLRKIPKRRKSHLHRGGNLKSRKEANEYFKLKISIFCSQQILNYWAKEKEIKCMSAFFL